MVDIIVVIITITIISVVEDIYHLRTEAASGQECRTTKLSLKHNIK